MCCGVPHQIRETMPEPLARRLQRFGVRNTIPPHVEALVMSCLAKRPGRRPQTAAVVADWLRADSWLGAFRARVRGWRNRMYSSSRPGGQS